LIRVHNPYNSIEGGSLTGQLPQGSYRTLKPTHRFAPGREIPSSRAKTIPLPTTLLKESLEEPDLGTSRIVFSIPFYIPIYTKMRESICIYPLNHSIQSLWSHDIAGKNCNWKLNHVSLLVSGLVCMRSTQSKPFWTQLSTCAVELPAGVK
jgi:hypothetical protein